MPLPSMDGKAGLNITNFRKGVQQMQADLRDLHEVAKKVSTIRITAGLSAGQELQRNVRAVRDAVQEMVPTGMAARINDLFGNFNVGVNSAKQSAAAFEAQSAALRERINQLDRAIRITRADFQAGLGEASKEEIAELTQQMNKFSKELEDVGQEARENFGEYSREAQKVANANRLAQATAAAARGEISRLGLASQVKLGLGGLQGYGQQMNYAAVGLFGLAQASDTARIATGLFDKTVQKTGQSSDQANKAIANLQDTLGVSADAAREGVRGLLRQGFTLEQANKALVGAGASALAAGKSAQEGMDAFVDAVTSGTSARLNEIGVSEDLSTFLQKEAKARGTTVDALDKQGRAQAALNLITTATNDEVGDLSALLGGVTGNASAANRELGEAMKTLGQTLIPIATNGIRVLTRFLDVFNELPEGGKAAVTILGASAVAIGVLAGPVSNLASGYKAIREGLSGVKGAADALQSGVKASGQLGDTVGDAAQSSLALQDVATRLDGAYATLNSRLTTSVASFLSSSASASVMSLAFAQAVGNTVLLNTSLGALTITAAAALAGVGLLAYGLGAYSVSIIKETQAIYDQIDADAQSSFDKTMQRVKELRSQNTELGAAQARVAILQERQKQLAAGTVTGVSIFGKRTVKYDEEAIQAVNKELKNARENVVQLYTEAQRRGALNVALTKEQTDAVKELNQALSGREFDLKVSGLTPLNAELARIDKTFEDLRTKFKAPFTVKGVLADVAQTPALRDGLAQLDTQREAERAAARKKAADDAVKTARESALAAQRAEIEAMQESAAKRTKLRDLDIADIKRQASEQAKALADAPKQAAQIEEDARRVIASKRAAWAREDQQQAKENAQRVRDAERSAQDSVIDSMEDGLRKREAIRARDVDNLRQSIEERVKALAGDPEAQRRVQQLGQQEVGNLLRQQQRERVKEVKDAQAQVEDAQRAARDAQVALITDEAEQRRAAREQEVRDYKKSVQDRLNALKDYPALQAQVLQAAAEQSRAITQRYQQEDQRDAKERAQRIATAWMAVRQAQQEAETTAADRTAAQYEARLARQLAVNRDNAVATAAIEAQAVRDRAKLATQAAATQSRINQERLATDRDKALENDKLSAQERQAIWAKYYADLQGLQSKSATDAANRAAALTQNQRDADEKLRAAQVQAAGKPIVESAARIQGLQLTRDTATTDAERIRINQQIAAEQAQQLAILREQVGPNSVLRLNSEERTEKEDQIKQILHDQKQAQLDQLAAARALTDAVQARAEAEAASAERNATTDQEVLAARLRLVGEYQKRLADLDGQIARAGKAEERERLLTARLGLTDQILEVEKKIAAMPQEQQQRALDLLNARRTAALQLSGLADDAVAAAELELEITQRQQAATRDKLNSQKLSDADRNALLIQEATLSGQAATQQRKITEAQQARVRLNETLADSEAALTRQLGEQGTQAAAMEAALNGVADARVKQARAERDYIQARQAYDQTASSGNLDKLRTATDALTSSVQGQRAAIKTLADAYRSQLSSMDSVRDAAEKLNQAVYGEAGRVFNSQTERQRLTAIEQRRDAARQRLVEALAGGDAEAIAAAVQAFSAQEERYRTQADRLEKQGVKFTRTGQAQAQQLADQVDALGIQQDREAVLVEQRQRIADREAQTVMTLGGAIDRFGEYGAALATRLRELQQPATPDRPTYYFDGQRFDSLAAVDAYDRARKAAPVIPATVPVTNTTITYSFGDINVSAPPTLNPRQIASDVRRELENDLRRNGRNC